LLQKQQYSSYLSKLAPRDQSSLVIHSDIGFFACNDMAFFPANFMLQTSHQDEHHQPPPSLNSIITSCAPQDYHGTFFL